VGKILSEALGYYFFDRYVIKAEDVNLKANYYSQLYIAHVFPCNTKHFDTYFVLYVQ
jgi:hypothetical protein